MTWRMDLTSTGRPSVILGGSGSLDALEERAAGAVDAGSRLYVLTDLNVRAAWGDQVLALLAPAELREAVLVLPPGETTKSVASAAACWEWLAARGARRNDIVVALGGGVIGDLAGFVASTHLRGMGLWQLPTSLLAQVDSSVGGKTAVNLGAGKNLVGSFYQPDLVVPDPRLLATLADNEYVNGLGEVAKYALLDDGGLLDLLESGMAPIRAREPAFMERVIERCISYKATVVEQDERDNGVRATLNLGHTTAHALEVSLGYGTIGHGTAVALGLLVALAVSEAVVGLPTSVRKRAESLLEALGLPTRAVLPPAEELLGAASRDKKVRAGSSGFVCLRDLGRPVWNIDVPRDVFRQALEVIRL